MAARIFWIFGGGSSLLALWLMAANGPQAGGITDYRAWLLLAVGIFAVTLGNFSRTTNRHH